MCHRFFLPRMLAVFPLASCSAGSRRIPAGLLHDERAMHRKLPKLHTQLQELLVRHHELRRDNAQLTSHMRTSLSQLEEWIAILADNRARSARASKRPYAIGRQ